MYLIQALVPLEFKQMQRPWREVWLPFLCALFVMMTLLPEASASAATYYVAKNGDNSGPGTESQPWLTIQHAANQAVAGDTVQVKAGSYNERVVLKNSGNAASGYITFQNFPGAKPVIDGTGLGNERMVKGEHISYIKFMGFHIKNHTGAGIEFKGTASHIEIRNNEISNQKHESGHGHAILVVAAYDWPPHFSTITDVIIDGNYIHDVQTGIAENLNYNEALTISFNVSKFQITNNVLDNVSFIGIDLIGKSPNSFPDIPHGEVFPHDGIIAHNEVKNSGSLAADTGIYVDGARDIVIEYNRVHDNTGIGIMVSIEDAAFTTKNILVRHNELWNNLRNLAPGASFGLSEAVRVVHNVVYSEKAGPTNIALFRGNDVVLKNNISFSKVGNFHIGHWTATEFNPSFNFNNYYPADVLFQYKGNHYNGFGLYQSGTGLDVNGISQDPLFVDVTQRDFHLQSGSLCIDAGGFLTTTTSGGNGTKISVEDSLYFSDGFGVVPGDLVKVGLNPPARIITVDHKAKTFTVDRSLAWSAGSGVSYPYFGSAPDMGAHEYELGGAGFVSTPTAPKGLQVVEIGN